MKKTSKKIFTLLITILFLIGMSTSAYLYFSGFDFESYFSALKLSMLDKILIVIFLFTFRNYLFIPSTVMILFAGFFLQDFWITLLLSTIWVAIGIMQAYFVWYVFWEDLKEKKSFHLISKYNDKIQNDGFKVIFLGALLPVIPVDIFYYSAGFVRYSIIKALIAGLIWELPLIILYVYLWKQAHQYTDYLGYIALAIIIIYVVYLAIKKIFFKK